MNEWYQSYLDGAERVQERIKMLERLIRENPESDERDDWIARKDLLKTERYDMLLSAEKILKGSCRGDVC